MHHIGLMHNASAGDTVPRPFLASQFGGTSRYRKDQAFYINQDESDPQNIFIFLFEKAVDT